MGLPKDRTRAFATRLQTCVLVAFQLDASRSNGMTPYGMGPHAEALERDAPNGRGDPAGRPYKAAMVATAWNGKVAIHSWNGTRFHEMACHSERAPIGALSCIVMS